MNDKETMASMHCYSLANQMILCQALNKWRKNPDMSFRLIFKDFYKNSIKKGDGDYNSKELVKTAIGITQASLLRQALVLNYEFLRNNINDKMTDNMKIIKNSASVSKNNYNTAKFLDILRQSFVHNNIYKDFPNWNFNKDGNIEIFYKNDAFIFEFSELQEIINEFLMMKKEHKLYSFEFEDGKLYDAIKKDKLNLENIGRYISCYDDKDNLVTLDNNQKQAILNLIHNGSISNLDTFEKLSDLNYHIFIQCFPLKNNAGALLRFNNRLFRNIIALNTDFTSRTNFLNSAKKFEEDCNIIDKVSGYIQEQNMIDFMYKDTMLPETIIYGNALFTLFSLYTPQDLERYMSDFDIETRRLRNSLMHGRYYFDYSQNFQFYDGKDKDNLEHIGTLSTKQMSTIFERYINEMGIKHNNIN